MRFLIAVFSLLSLSNGDLGNNEDHFLSHRLHHAPFEVHARITKEKNLSDGPANHAENMLCPDKKASCEEGDTCCLTTHDRYGCCPLPHAVCCSDKVHCCPQGTHCDVKHNRCTEGDTGLAAGSNISMTRLVVKHQSPAERNYRAGEGPKKLACPVDSSPCVSKGTPACCPLKNGVCCPDGLHCCPSGYKCAVDKCQLDERNAWLSILATVFA